MVHPTCGSKRTPLGAKIIAICDLIFALFGTFWFGYMLEGYGVFLKPLQEDPMNERSIKLIPMYINSTSTPNGTLSKIKITNVTSVSQNGFLSLMGGVDNNIPSAQNMSDNGDGFFINGKAANIFLSGFYTLVNLGVFVLLLSAAHEKNITKLKIWFSIRLIILLFKAVLYTSYVAVGAQIFIQLPHLVFMTVHAYGLWLVAVFIKEIRQEQKDAAVLKNNSNITVFEPMPMDLLTSVASHNVIAVGGHTARVGCME